MTILLSPPYGSLTVRFSQMVELELFPWFDEAYSAYANLKHPLFGINEPMQHLFAQFVPTEKKSVNVFAATLDFAGSDDHGVPEDVCLKFARGVDAVVRLSHEASIYRKRLFKLWGFAVPRMYGFFMGHHEDEPVACLLLELCNGPSAPLHDVEEFM